MPTSINQDLFFSKVDRSSLILASCFLGITLSLVTAKVYQKTATESTANKMIVKRKPSSSSPPPKNSTKGLAEAPTTSDPIEAKINLNCAALVRSPDSG